MDRNKQLEKGEEPAAPDRAAEGSGEEAKLDRDEMKTLKMH